MAKPKVIVTHPFLRRPSLQRKARVLLVRNRRELLKQIPYAQGLLTLLTDTIDRQLLKNAGQLRVVGNMAVGIDNIDLQACHEKGIRVVNTPDVLVQSTAELSLALLLAAGRRFHEGERLTRKGKFKGWDPEMLLGREFLGKTAVIAGKGKIGRKFGQMLRAVFSMKILWITRQDSNRSIRQKLKHADVLSLHMPLTPSTRHWLDDKRLRQLPASCIVVNTSRGPVIDEKALIRRLQTGRLYAAGLDVFEHEPSIPSALRRLLNAVMLPHLGSATVEARTAMAEKAIAGVLSVLAGKRPSNLVRKR